MLKTAFKCTIISSALMFLSMSYTFASEEAIPSSSATFPTQIVLEKQGSFFVGGNSQKSPEGNIIYGDYAYVDYQIPVNPRAIPLIMWHGGGQSGKTWDTTADGREGYKQILTRKGWPVYIIDEPRTGRAGSSLQSGNLKPSVNASSQILFEAFRIGTWPAGGEPHFYPGVQFPQDPQVIEQFIKQGTPRSDGFTYTDDSIDYTRLGVAAMRELLNKTGPVVLITHSASGGPGWETVLSYPKKIKGVVAYEPGKFIFPEGDVPMGVMAGASTPHVIPMKQFKILTQLPIQIVFGDNIDKGSFYDNCLQGAKSFVSTINKYGGNAELIVLPEVGIKGNTHFPFSDLNNVQISDLLSRWLEKNKLNK